MTSKQVKAAVVQIEKANGNPGVSGFRDWTYHMCWLFMYEWDSLENQGHGEMAACGIACERFGLKPDDAEWVGIVEAIANME